MAPQPLCEHLARVIDPQPSGDGCVECLVTGDRWVALRMCAACGHVGCCDSSRNRHASAHAGQTGHPVIHSYQPGEDWWWCYPDELWVPSLPGHPPIRG